MEGQERKAKPEPGICPDEYANKKLVGRQSILSGFFDKYFWPVKNCLTATLGRAVGEQGDQSRETLHLKLGMMINRYTKVF